MNNENNNNFIDVESSPVSQTEQVAWGSYYNDEKPKKRKGGFRKVLGKIAGGLLLAMVGGLFGSGATYMLLKDNSITAQTKTTTYVPQSFTTNSSKGMSAADAFNKVAPSVVIVSTKSLEQSNSMFGGTQEVEGIGSGFIINKDGYILTNYHVIAGAKQVTVTLSDKTEVTARVINSDQNRDVAMLKLKDGTKVPGIAELGDSDSVYPGQEVIAIGTPLSKEFAQTITKGVISGSNRSTTDNSGQKLSLLQTDAAINPGNSGGPLVNTQGQVIGINSMKIGTQINGTSVEGIGFAIPINEVKNKISALTKPMLNLGIMIKEVDKVTAEQNDITPGLWVSDVDDFSPADKGGMKMGDIIVKCDGKDARTFAKFKEIKEGKKAGDVLKLEVVRNNKTINLSVQLEDK